MTILETIKKAKIEEVKRLKSVYSVLDFEKSIYFDKSLNSMKTAIIHSESGGIISEFKRKSPAKGNINLSADVIKTTKGYSKAGVSGLSVLTDADFFGADRNDFEQARLHNKTPLLRKDFIVDEFQILQSKAMGADVILLIAKVLTKKEMVSFCKTAHQLNMEVFFETQTEAEILENFELDYDFIGINNRNLNSFEVSIENSIRLANLLPKESVKIAESGIDSLEAIQLLRQNGFDGFLIGEYFMKADSPEIKCAELLSKLK
jgi:indole-3-glycerol phosphate synthase